VREADLTTFMCWMSWKSGSLNFLESSGPHWACNGTALPLPFHEKYYDVKLEGLLQILKRNKPCLDKERYEHSQHQQHEYIYFFVRIVYYLQLYIAHNINPNIW